MLIGWPRRRVGPMRGQKIAMTTVMIKPNTMTGNTISPPHRLISWPPTSVEMMNAIEPHTRIDP